MCGYEKTLFYEVEEIRTWFDELIGNDNLQKHVMCPICKFQFINKEYENKK